MNNPKTRIFSSPVYWLGWILLLSLFYFIKFKGYLFTEYFYQKQNFDILNKITDTNDIRSLDFYIGEVENVLLGPLQSIISGLLFLSFCLKFLKKSSPWQFGAAIVIYLILTRPETLFYPPMGEGITGPFSDTIWLLQHNLNYFGLLKQDTAFIGGPQVYPTALYPFFVSILMKSIPNPKIFLLIMHMSYFLMAAAILALIRKVAQKIFDNKEFCLLIPLLILFMPLFQCMVELINLEIPCLFFAMLTAYYLIRNRIGAAALASLGALFVKDPGIIACVAVFIITFLKYSTQDLPRNYRNLLWAAIIMIIAGIKSYLRGAIIGEQKNFNMVAFLSGWQNTWPSVWFYVYLFSLISALGFIFYQFKVSTGCKAGAGHFFNKILHCLVHDHMHITVILLFATLWFLLYLNFLTLAYRYLLLLMPFLIFSLCYALSVFITKPVLLQRTLIFLIFISLLSSHGLMYGWQHGVAWDNKTETEPTNLERSLEYRNFIKLQLDLAKEIEEHYSQYAIVAPFQTAQYLGIPELGYVSKDLDVTLYGMRETLGLKPFLGIKYLDLRKTVFVGFPGQRLEKINIPYPIDPQDKILKRLERGHIDVVIFMGGIAIERMRILVTILMKDRGKSRSSP